MILKGKVAVIYGAGGAIGGAIARAFAPEGARVFLTGRSRTAVDAVAKDIGGGAQAAEVDAVDEQAIDKHLQAVIDSETTVQVELIFRSTRSGFRRGRFWGRLSSIWMSSSSLCQSRPTSRRTF